MKAALDQILTGLQPAIEEALKNSLGPLLITGGLLLVITVLAVPLLILTKRRGSSTLRIQIGSNQTPGGAAGPPPALTAQADSPEFLSNQMLGDQSQAWQPAGQPWSDRREELLRNLDSVERGFGRFYAVLLCVIMAISTGVAVLLYLRLPDDGNRAFHLLYGGVAYGLLVTWALSQLFSVMRRISPPPDFLTGMRSRINLNIQTAPQVQFLDDSALDRAQHHLDSGGTLAEACGVADPRYRSMNGTMQQLFQTAVRSALDQRGRQRN